MLLTASEFRHKAEQFVDLEVGSHIGFDVETTGLSVYKGAEAFLLGFTDAQGERFCVYLSPELKEDLALFFSNSNIKYCAHNAKFELSFLRHQFGVEVMGIVWDTEVTARLEKNNHMSYALQKCAERLGLSKHEPMAEWLAIRGNKNQYHKAPKEIIEPYVEHDAWLSWELCRRHIEQFRHWDKSSPVPISPVVSLELNVLPHLFNMESYGLLIDVNYCMRALEYERGKIEAAAKEFESQSNVPLVDSRKTLVPVFDRLGIGYDKTDHGNASFTEEVLSGSKSSPVVRALLEHRASTKRASTYWENFLSLEVNGIIHPNIHQNRAKTGRMSVSEPSCQNWPRDDEEDDPKFPVRRAFVARPGCKIVSMDYSQMEIRLMCDEANDKGMIEAFKSGKDFHQETADMAKVPRSLAKNGRFAKLYGAGVARVAKTLGVSEALARTICEAIDKSSPGVAAYCRNLISYAKRTKQGYNFLGRRFNFDDGFFYVYPNYRIQSGCGEILKTAICSIGKLLKDKHKDTRILLPVHDELVMNIHKSDMHLLPEIKRLMIAAHKSKKNLEMDVGVYVGDNFYDLEEIKLNG